MYVIEQQVDRRWMQVGGLFAEREQAYKKALEYQMAGSEKNPKFFRVRRVR